MAKARAIDGADLATGLVRPFPVVFWSFRSMLAALVLIDCGFIGLNVVASSLVDFSVISAVPVMLKVTQDGSLPEIFNYLKWAVIVAALLWTSARDRWLTPLAWAVVFAMILADDALQLHETYGEMISVDFSLPSSALLFGSDLGEILVFLTMGVIATVLAILATTRSSADARRMSLRYYAVLLGLAVFGVGVDALHQIVSHLDVNHTAATLFSQIAGMIEDGGEMIVASVAAALTLVPPAQTPIDRILPAKLRDAGSRPTDG